MFNTPKLADQDDLIGEPLVQRDDDKEATVARRLEVYHAMTKPLVQYYSAWAASNELHAPHYAKIAGVGTLEQIRDKVFAARG